MHIPQENILLTSLSEGKRAELYFSQRKNEVLTQRMLTQRASVLTVMTTSEVRQNSLLLAQQSPVKVTCFFEAAHLHIYYFIVYVSHSASPDDNICLQKPKIRFH